MRARFNDFPRDVPQNDLITFFTLSVSDLEVLPRTTTGGNRLGF
jgi:hypothetical protein